MLNVVILTGRLSRDPVLSAAGEPGERVNLTVAFNERVGQTDQGRFIDVTMWGKGASNVAEHLAKGDEVHVKGRLSQREEGKDSTGQYSRPIFSVIADSFGGITFGRKKGSGNGDSQANGNGQAAAPAAAPAEQPPIPF